MIKLVAGIWLIAAPAFLFAGLAYAEAIWCSPPDPDGGMRRDTEMCGGDDGALLLGVAQVMVVWLLGMIGLILWARPRRPRAHPDR